MIKWKQYGIKLIGKYMGAVLLLSLPVVKAIVVRDILSLVIKYQKLILVAYGCIIGTQGTNIDMYYNPVLFFI